MKKSVSALLVVLLLLFGLMVIGCGDPDVDVDDVDVDDVDEDDVWPSQEEVVAAIDEVIADYEDGVYSDEEVIEALREVIPQPEGFPARTIEYIVPWGEGGGSDNYARFIGRDAAIIMDETIVYNNMPGGGGEVALAYLFTQRPDGHTIYGAIANQTINDALGTQPHSFTNDCDFIIRNQGATEIYWVLPDSPFETMEEALQYAVDNPGQLTVCGAGAGGDDEFRLASLERELGTEIVYVPYDAVGERVSSLLGGHVDIMHETVGTVIDLYEAGEIRPLAYGGDIVFEELDPDIPSIADLGYEVPVGRWRGMTTVGGTDPQIIDYLHNVFYASSQLPYYKDYEREFFQHLPAAYLNSADFEAYARQEVADITELARELGYID